MNEYWRNPEIHITQGKNFEDPIAKSLHDGTHCLFYNPCVEIHKIPYQKLEKICTWANTAIQEYGVDNFCQIERNWHDMANIVRLNMWTEDIKKQGIVKPLLLTYNGRGYGINTGESRLRCVESIPTITTARAFISTHCDHASHFHNLDQITCFDDFALACGTHIGTEYQFKCTDPTAPYGLEWYEYSSEKPIAGMIAESKLVEMCQNYILSHNGIVFTKEWFAIPVDWSAYTRT